MRTYDPWDAPVVDTPCRACKGANRASYHLTLSKWDTETALSVCRGCLTDAPTWAGWETWPQHMKEQRAWLLGIREEVTA